MKVPAAQESPEREGQWPESDLPAAQVLSEGGSCAHEPTASVEGVAKSAGVEPLCGPILNLLGLPCDLGQEPPLGRPSPKCG